MMQPTSESAVTVPEEADPEPMADDRNDRGAMIEAIFREHNPSLLRFLQARLASAQDAREVAQEAYVRLLQLDSPGAIGFLRAYLFKTAANLATDRLRHRRVAQLSVEREFFNLDPPSPMDTVAAQQDLEVLSAAMDELSPKCREVFMLRRLGNLRTDEIAHRTHIGPRMVRLYIAQALAHCQSRLMEAHQVRSSTSEDHSS
jgi:RNA polymerase sigma-70 factor (ECF subfamily)